MSGIPVIVGGAAKNDKPSGIIGGAEHKIYDRHVIVGGAAKLVYRRGLLATGQYNFIMSEEARWHIMQQPTITVNSSGVAMSGLKVRYVGAGTSDDTTGTNFYFLFEVDLDSTKDFVSGNIALKNNAEWEFYTNLPEWVGYVSARLGANLSLDSQFITNPVYVDPPVSDGFVFPVGYAANAVTTIALSKVAICIFWRPYSTIDTDKNFDFSFSIPPDALSIFAGNPAEEYPVIFE